MRNFPNVIAYNSAISACVLRGAWQEALQLLEDVPLAEYLGLP